MTIISVTIVCKWNFFQLCVFNLYLIHLSFYFKFNFFIEGHAYIICGYQVIPH